MSALQIVSNDRLPASCAVLAAIEAIGFQGMRDVAGDANRILLPAIPPEGVCEVDPQIRILCAVDADGRWMIASGEAEARITPLRVGAVLWAGDLGGVEGEDGNTVLLGRLQGEHGIAVDADADASTRISGAGPGTRAHFQQRHNCHAWRGITFPCLTGLRLESIHDLPHVAATISRDAGLEGIGFDRLQHRRKAVLLGHRLALVQHGVECLADGRSVPPLRC